MKQNIILDVDPGVDDAVSMIYGFLSNRLEIRLICVTKGNKDLRQSTLNALFITENCAKKPVPVVQGADGPIKPNKIPVLNVHGKSGLGRLINVTEVASQTINRDGYGSAEAIRDCVKKYSDVIYICNGPSTSLALALQKYPEIARRLKMVLIMGGTMSGGGSITPYASFNIFSDPDATSIVLKSGAKVRFSPSETGLSVFLDQEILNRWEGYGKYGSLVKKLYTGYHDLLLPTDKFATHDLCALMSITHPEFFEIKKVEVSLNTGFGKKRGQTIFKEAAESKVELVSKANREKIVETFDKLLKRSK